MEIVKKMGQVEWVAEMFKKAFLVKSFYAEFPDGIERKVIWLRGLHYFIATLPEEQRQIPTVRGTRLYLNTKHEYQYLSKSWVKAQLKGLIDSDLIWDNRNDFMIECWNRKKANVLDLDYQTSSGYYYSNTVNMLKTFDEFKGSINIQPSFSSNVFSSQFYEMIVVTEKLTVKAIIKGVCKRHGANCQILKGQSSFTRVRDICKKAMKNKRPILLFGIYDLDCAGWDMPTSFMNRVNQIYPHQDHKFIRVALNRDQVKEYDLPVSFEPDDKGYPEVQKERFYRESEGTSCIELDAMDNTVIKDLLRGELYKYSGLKLDEIQERRFKKKEGKRVRCVVKNFDAESYRQKYELAYKRYAKFYNTIKDKQDFLKAKYDFITDKIWDIKCKIEKELKKEINNGEKVDQE